MPISIQPIINLCGGDRNAEQQITMEFYYECANNLYRIINAFVAIEKATPDEIGGLLGTIKTSSHLLKGVMSTLSMNGMTDYFTQLEKTSNSEFTITTYFEMKKTIIDTIRFFNTIVLEINTRYETEYRVVANIDYKDRYSDILTESKQADDNADKIRTNDIAKTDFLKYVFHEARNQLNSVTVGVDNILHIQTIFINKLILYEHKTPHHINVMENLRITLDILNHVAIACTNTIAILNDTLDLQKIQENKMEFCYEYVNIFSRIKTYVENVQRTYKDKSITVSGYCSLKHMLFYMDGTKIYQAITNVINNACKFTKDMVTINIRVEMDDDIPTKTKLIVDVIDNGVDFDESFIDKLFKPFSQLRNGIKLGGSGLGLNISKKFIEKHGGVLTVKRENDTTIFTIFIQCSYTFKEKMNETEIQQVDPELLYRLNPYILIVEDSVIIRKMYGVMFDQLKIKYDIAENGKIAIDKAVATKYGVILMDKEMPVMGGYEATREILKINPKQVIIGLTGNALLEQQTEFMECGLSDILIKPINREHLIYTIHKYIS